MAAMEARLTKEVTRMRAQLMSFSNEGGGNVSLNVPDTNEVKDVFGQVVTTVVQQQKQITTLQTTMKQMAEDHAASQASLIAWTAQCVNELIAQNAATESRLQDARTQLRNISYNMQGYDDHVDTAPPVPPPIQISPPVIVKTVTPKIIADPMEVGDGGGTLFPTETGAPPDSSLNLSENARWGGPSIGATAAGVGLVGHAAAIQAKPHRKSDSEREKAKAFYLSIAPTAPPKSSKGRWKWAYRQVLHSLRLKSMKVGVARKKLPQQQTAAERMNRVEQELFALPIALKKYTDKIADQLGDRITGEVSKIEGAMQEAREETARITTRLQSNIDAVSQDLRQVDERLVQLKDQVDNANKQQDEVERKLNVVIARVGEHEVSKFDSFKSRVTDLLDKVGALQARTNGTTEKLAKLNDMATGNGGAVGEPVAVESGEAAEAAAASSGVEEGGDHKLFDMLEMDTMLRAVRIEINALDSGAFAVGEILRGLRYEVLSSSVLAGPDQPVAKEAVNELLSSCDAIVATLDVIFGSIRATNDAWGKHDIQLAERWKDLAGVADAVKLVAEMSTALEEVRCTVVGVQSTIETLPSKNEVESISQAVAGSVVQSALQPVDQKIDIVEGVLRDMSGQIKNLQSSAGSNSQSSQGLLGGDIDTQLEPLVQRIVEMHLGKAPQSWRGPVRAEDPLFTAQELELMASAEALDDETASNVIEQGTLVRVLMGEFMDRQGIVTDVIAAPWVSVAEGKSEVDDTEKSFGEPTDMEPPADRTVRYRVSLSPDTPLSTPQVTRGELEPPFPTFEEAHGDHADTSLPARAASSGNMTHIQREIDRLSRTIENLLSGKLLPAGASATNNQREDANRADAGRRAPSPAGAHRSSGGVDNGVMEAIQEAIQDVLGQIGDLRELQEKEISKAKQQMKQAIITAVTRAITDKDKEDKASFLTTRSMCIGCGRPSLVRKEDNSAPAQSLGFVPGLNSASTPGPDVYRAGFKMPVHVQQQRSSPVPQAFGFNDDAFDQYEGEEGESGIHPNTVSTSSEILANLASSAGVLSVTDAGAAGMAFTIAPSTSPIKLSSTAKAIRHAQGRDEAAMLRPIHRKNFPGKKSERARAAYAPERFDLPNDLSVMSKSMSSLKAPSP